MSTIYLIAFNKDNAFTKTKYYYKHILENKEKITDERPITFETSEKGIDQIFYILFLIF